MSTADQLLIKDYIEGMWGEFNKVRKNTVIAPLILAFAIIEASAKLSVPNGVNSPRSRFIWWVNEFLKNTDSSPYSELDLYGARCGLFHEYGAESDLSRSGKCKIIVWVDGAGRDLHNKENSEMHLLHIQQFYDDLYNAGIKLIERLKVDIDMQQRFAKRLPKILRVTSFKK